MTFLRLPGRPSPWLATALLALLGVTGPFAPASAETPLLVPGEPIQSVYVVEGEAWQGGASGCVGVVKLTIVRSGAYYTAVMASVGPEGCASDLCAPFQGNGEVACEEDEVFGFYGANLPAYGVDFAFTEAACLRNATLHVDANGDGTSDAPLELATVTLGPC